jgi:succinate dehydrogenase / fumarate reductase cytochrome b subunit
MKYAYYPGCAAKGSTPEADFATKLVARRLGIELLELQNSGCCGAKEIRVVGRRLDLNLNARILALAQGRGLDILTICNTCLLNLTQANNQLKADPETLKKVNESLSEIDLDYDGGTSVKHFLHVILTDFGLDRLKQNVVAPLKGLKVAPFYGCHIVRPVKDLGFDVAKTESLEALIKALGAEPVEYQGRTKCCGFYVLMPKEAAALSMVACRLEEALSAEADCIVTPCPLCHIALDMCQKQALDKAGINRTIPILHLPQLVGLAFGIPEKELQFNRHLIRVNGLKK